MKEYEDFIYVIKKDEIIITGYIGKASVVRVPKAIGELPVTVIGADAFRDCSFLTKIILPDGIKSIGDYSFCNCGLTEFTFNDRVTKIGRHAFYNCRGLKTLYLPGMIRDIGDGAFKNCEEINRVYIKASTEQLLSLKYTLGSLSQNVWVHIEYSLENKKEKAILVFPKDAVYYAYYTTRLNDKTTFGIGNQYHYCVGNGVIDYARYDSLFLGAKNELEQEILCEIALNRVMAPYELEEIYKGRYMDYIKEHILPLTQAAITKEDMEVMEFLTTEKLIEEEELAILLDYAREYRKTTCISLLLSYQNKNYNKKKQEFLL